MKSLTESLFDDNIKKDIMLDDILELEGWEVADVRDQDSLYETLTVNWPDDSFMKKYCINSTKWKDFLKPLEDKYKRPEHQVTKYWFAWQFWYFTWVVMCCKSSKEVEEKLTQFMNETILHVWNGGRDYWIKDIEVKCIDGLGTMKGLPRIIAVNLHTNHDRIIFYMKLKKRA